MPGSPEYNVHTEMLYDSLISLLGNTAVRLSPGYMLSAGLLNMRLDDKNKYYRPRMVVISGVAGWIEHLVGGDVLDNALIIGATRQDDPSADIGRIFAANSGTAKDILQRRDLEDWEVAKLGRRIRGADPETPNASQAELYCWRVREKLDKPRPSA